ncbi:hypothetical protein ACXAT6_003112 [Clostridium sporogenes]
MKIKEFVKYDLEGFTDGQLFEKEEEEKAKSILSTLEGMSIDSAKTLLDKCNCALTQMKVGKVI